MKKLIITLVALSVLLLIAYLFLWLPSDNKKALHLIPDDAAFILSASQPIDSWKEFSGSKMWQHLKQSEELDYFTQEANALDSLISENDWLGIFGDQDLYISTHINHTGNQYLYLVDLGKSANISIFDSYLQSLLGTEEYSVTSREIQSYKVTELYFKQDRETLYFVFIGNIMVASYSPQLVEKSIAQSRNSSYNQPLTEVTDLIGEQGLFRVYVNYDQFGQYLSNYIDIGTSLNWLPATLSYSGLAIEINDDINQLTGYTNYTAEGNPYIRALHKSGMAEHHFLEILPKESPYFIALGFKKMSYFIEQLEDAMQKDSLIYEDYQKEVATIEKFLAIDIHKDLFSWMGSEMVFFQSEITGSSGKNQLAFMVSLDDREIAMKSMEDLQRKIKKKTPIKIQSLAYKQYTINYLAMKGIFKPFFGNMFTQMDKPYYVIIDDWIVFSSHPQSLKKIIDDYTAGHVLSNSPEFYSYYQKLAKRSAAFCYVSIPKVYDQLKNISNAVQTKNIIKNAPYINAFSNVSFQLVHQGQTFETFLNWQYKPDADKASNNTTFVQESVSKQIQLETDDYLTELKKIDQIRIEDLSERKYRIYYPNKEVQYEFKLRDGWKHGNFESYYPNGETKFKGKYKDDQKEGTWKLYNVNGDLIQKYEFEAGKLLSN